MLRAGRRRDRVGFLFVLLIAAPVLTAWLVGASSWLPEERITVEGRAPVAGFVLDAGFHWTTVLVPSDDHVLHLRTDEVRTPTLCGEHARARSVLESSAVRTAVATRTAESRFSELLL